VQIRKLRLELHRDDGWSGDVASASAQV